MMMSGNIRDRISVVCLEEQENMYLYVYALSSHIAYIKV